MNAFFITIINMSISASWLILAVLILRLLLKKAPKWLNVLLWGIVAVRLLCPISIESALSLIPSAQTIPVGIELYDAPAIDSGIAAINDILNPILTQTAAPEIGDSVNPLQIVVGVGWNIWIVGVIVLLAYASFSYLRLRRKVDTAILYRDNIFQTEYISSPFVLGIFRPRIYLPFTLDGQDRDHVIAHELSHIRRRDHWWKPLGFLLLSIHWFNPLMWLAYVLLCRDIELACDERVIHSLDNNQRADYTQALLTCSVNRSMIAACPLAFGEVGVKERVKSVMNYRKPAFWVIVISVLACIAIGICFLTNPPRDNYLIFIRIPAGSAEAFYYSDEEFSPTRNHVTVAAAVGHTQVVLQSVSVQQENVCEPVNVTSNQQVTLPAERGSWYRLGIKTSNSSQQDVIITVEISDIREIRISDSAVNSEVVFDAEVLEVHDGYLLVEPIHGSPAYLGTGPIEVPSASPPETEVGTIIRIVFNGLLLETYPARIQEVYNIQVIQPDGLRDLIPMVMVNGVLYLDTGTESTVEGRCGMLDGEITSAVDQSETPTQDNQSNFGTGYGYQFGETERTIDVLIDGQWWIFATEEVRQGMQSSNTPKGYYLTIGSEGVVSIEIQNTNKSGGCANADGSPFQKGERVWLEPLDGCTNLRGVTITALDANGVEVWKISIPDKAGNQYFSGYAGDGWALEIDP